MARGQNLESARVQPAPADAPSQAGTCLAGTCLARSRQAHSRPPAPPSGLPPSPRAGPPPPPPDTRAALSPTPPCAPDAKPAARAQQCPHLVTPTTFRTASGNEIKSLGRGGDVHPNNRGGWQVLRRHWLRRPEPASGPARSLPRPVAGGCAPAGSFLSDRLPRLPGRPRRRGFLGPCRRPPASATAGRGPRVPPPARQASSSS